MLNKWVNFQFSIMKKLWDIAHENLVNIQGSHGILVNIHGYQPYPRNSQLGTKSAQKR